MTPAETERAAQVEWLCKKAREMGRNGQHSTAGFALISTADAILRGEHLTQKTDVAEHLTAAQREALNSALVKSATLVTLIDDADAENQAAITAWAEENI